MEDRIRQLEIQVAELRNDAKWTRILGGNVGMLLLAFLGYASFLQIPREVKATAAGKAGNEIIELRNAASNHVRALNSGAYVKYDEKILLQVYGSTKPVAIGTKLGDPARLAEAPGPETSFAIHKPNGN